MPYTEMLQDHMTGNTPDSIRACLRFLYNEPSYTRTERYKVSIVYGFGKSQVSLGDDLELANPHTNKVRKKRWWESDKKPTDQLRLPFPAYQPAEVIRVSEDRYGDELVLSIQYKGDDNTTCRTTAKFSIRRGLRSRNTRDIKAIKIHCVIKHWDSEENTEGEEIQNTSPPFYPYEGPRRQFVPSREQCITLLSRAVQNGLVVATTQVVYDKETHERIGHDIILDRESRLSPPDYSSYQRPEHYRCSMKMADGETYAFIIIMSDVEFIREDSYSPPTPSPGPWGREGFSYGASLDGIYNDEYWSARRRLGRVSDESRNSNCEEQCDDES